MNKRIVLIDREETPNFCVYFSYGLGDKICIIQDLENMDESSRRQILDVGPGDGVLLVGGEPFKYLRQYYHFGIRSENYFDCSKLKRLSISGGAFVKCIIDDPVAEDIQYFLSPEFTKEISFNLRWKTLSTFEEAEHYLNWLDNLPEDTYFGFDYEGSGMPLEILYELSGCAICTVNVAGFISLTDIRHQLGGKTEKYYHLLGHLGRFLEKRMSRTIVYNMSYEWQASLRMLGVDLYNLMDASVVNVVDGEHLKKYSLKWTAQRILGVSVWDTDFDLLSDLIESMLFSIEGKLKRDKHRVLKVEKNTFENTPEWKEITQRYPEYVNEFKSLILEYWGNEFMCIPSQILGKYCCLDAFYTLLIFLAKKDEYSQECWDVFMDNTRLGCRIMSGGLYIDEPFRARYEKYCHEQMAWGITYCAIARCWVKMEKHQENMTNIKRYKPVAAHLLRKGKFFKGDPLEITKYLLVEYLDFMDTTDTGLDEGRLQMDFMNIDPNFASNFVDIVKESMVEVKMKTKIGPGIERKKKILGVISGKIVPLLGLDKVKINKKHVELEKYLFYEKGYWELQRIFQTYFQDMNNMPEKVTIFGETKTLLDYSDYVSDTYFKCKSPEENDEFVYDFAELYRSETAYLTSMMESIQQLPETDKFYSSRGIVDINQGFQEFMEEWKNWFNLPNNVEYTGIYPEKVFQLAMKYYQSGFHTKSKVTKTSTKTLYYCDEKMKDMWTDFAGFNIQTSLFPQYAGQFEDYARGFDPNVDLDNNNRFFFIRKMMINYLLYKKYSKLCSTYVGSSGMFKKNNRWVIENENHLPIRYADPGEPGAVEKCFVKYEVNEKSSKRWSSAFHTIISHGDCKDVLCPPPSWDENGNIIYGGSNQLLTYFDISSAEVKAAGFASMDPDLIAKFRAGEDIKY